MVEKYHKTPISYGAIEAITKQKNKKRPHIYIRRRLSLFIQLSPKRWAVPILF